MTQATYNYIWDNIIKTNIDAIKNKANKSSEECKIEIDNLDKVKAIIFTDYERKRNELKEMYHFDDGKEEQRIDSHKIAACFASSIYDNNILKYEISDKVTDDIFLANSRLAYHVSLGIVYLNLVYKYKINNNITIFNKLLEQKKLIVPPTNPGHDTYNLGREKTLALNQIFDNGFDLLTYSDMMFWIEFYNRQLLENKIIPEPLDDKELDINNMIGN